MTAPRGVELHQHVLVVVQHQVSKALTLEHNNRAGSVFRGDLLSLQVRLQRSSEKGSEVSGNGLGGELAGQGVFLQAAVRAHVREDEGGEVSEGDAWAAQGYNNAKRNKIYIKYT